MFELEYWGSACWHDLDAIGWLDMSRQDCPAVKENRETPGRKQDRVTVHAEVHDAEGCFSVVIFKNKTSKYGEAIKISFILTQHIRDEIFIKNFIEYFGCGYTSLDPRGTIDFKVTDLSNIKNVIIPFFNKYGLQGNKNLDFSDFSKVVSLMVNKKHLTQEGLTEIKKIKNQMNTKRSK